MKPIRLISNICPFILSTLIFSACGPSLDTHRMNEGEIRSHANDPLTSRLCSELNAYRTSQGLPPLPRHAGLDKLAQQHSEFMRQNRGKFSGGSGNVSHFGFEERSLFAQRQLGMGNVAENVASVTQVGDKADHWISQTWIKSEGHRFNLVQKWDVTGIGVAMDKDGTVFATQIFATKSNSQMEMKNRMRQF
jgi:uncharacterized protein YkwD